MKGMIGTAAAQDKLQVEIVQQIGHTSFVMAVEGVRGPPAVAARGSLKESPEYPSP